MIENALKDDICLFENEITCFNSSSSIDYSLFKYNVLFDDNEIIDSEVPSGVKCNVGHVAILMGYKLFDNPLWIDDTCPHDGNLFLESHSMLVGKDCSEKEGDIYLQSATSSLSVPIIDNMLDCVLECNNNLTNEDTLDEIILQDTFLYYLFAYDDAHACV